MYNVSKELNIFVYKNWIIYIICKLVFFSDELSKFSKEGFGRYVDKDEMSKDHVLPSCNCFCAYVKTDIRHLDESFFSLVRDKDCTKELYTTRHEEFLVGRLNEEKQRVSDLEAHVKQQDEIWRRKVRDYELQVAAINEHQHQKAETRKLEIEVHQHGPGTQHTYKMDKKPQEKTFQDQFSRKVVHKQPVKQEPKVHREDMNQ